MSSRIPKEIEDAIVAVYLNGASKEEAAALFGYSSHVCHNALKRRGIKARNVSEAMFASPHIRRIPKEHEDAMVTAYLAGSTAKQVAAQFGYSDTSCYNALRNRGIDSRSPSELYRMPSDHEDAIVSTFLAGSTAKQAAAQFGYSESTGQNVLKRRGIKTRPLSETRRRYAVDESFFERVDTPDKAYWLGFLTADGVIGGWTGSRPAMKIARERKATVITIEDIDHFGIERIIEYALEIAWKGARAVWLSFDIDSVDPAFAPGTGTPEPGGLLPREVFKMLRLAAREGLQGMELVEVSPPYDVSDITALLGGRVIMDVLATLTEKGKPGHAVL